MSGIARTIVLITGIIAGISGWTGPVAASDPLAKPEDIVEVFRKALEAGDASLVAPYYAPDARLYPSDGSVVRGRQAIQEETQKGFDAADRTLEGSHVRVYGDDKNAVLVWNWQLRNIQRGLTSFESGRSLHVFQNGDDGWQIHQDMIQVLQE